MNAGQRQVGHAAIRAFLDARPVDRITRHICTNIRVDMTSPTTASGSCSTLMLLASAPRDTPLPVPISPPVVVDYQDEYVLTDEGWKFKCRTVQIVFH